LISEYIVEKYIRLCNFPNLKKQGNKWNFRCPLCGDSKKHKNKKRGFIIYNQLKYNVPIYKCHNCGEKMSFESYLKEYKSNLFDEYKLELIGDDLFKRPVAPPIVIKRKSNNDILKHFDSIYSNKNAIDYLKKRKLPKRFVDELYYSDNYMKVLSDNKLVNTEYESKYDKRIVIPIYNKNKELIYIQGRSLDKDNSLRYITTTIKEDEFKLWGLDRVNLALPVYCLEGIFDACFIPNSLAPLGASFDVNELKKYVNIYLPDFDIYSNIDVRRNCVKWVDTGNKIFIPPSNIKGKDMNDLVKDYGYKLDDIMKLIKSNLYQGVLAKVKLQSIGKI